MLKKTEFVEKNNGLRVHAADFDPAETIVALLARAGNDPFLIPTSILSSAANYTLHFRFTSLFRLTVEYSLERLRAERCAYPTIPEDCAILAKRLLTLCAHDYVAHKDLLARLVETIIPRDLGSDDLILPDFIEDLPMVTLLGLIRSMTESPDMSRYLYPLDVLTTAVLKSTPKTFHSSKKIGAGTWTLYRLVIALVENGHRAGALDLFRKLLAFHRFPAAATLEMDAVVASKPEGTSTAFDAVILTSIARACQLCGWNERNARVLRLLVMRCDVSASRGESDMVSRIIHNNIIGLITEGTEGTLLNAASLFQQCLENPVIEPPPPPVLECLYLALHQRSMYDTMHSLFGRVQYVTDVRAATVAPSAANSQYDPVDDRRYKWPLYKYPHGEACLGLLDYIFTKFKTPEALRPFALHHANQPHELQDQHSSVPRLIALYAKAGCVDEAMRIWSECRVGSGAEILAGNATAVISLVKSLVSQAASKSANNSSRRRRRVRRRDARSPQSSSSHEMQNAAPMSVTEYQERCLAAARQIASDFTRLNRPLSTAAHSTLTSIAHANFLIGDLPKAFAALTTILDRRTIPDEHDIAVAIHGVARSDPARAASALDTALKRGVTIGKEAWTSVLKEALAAGDYALAEILLRGLNDAGIETDAKLIDAVVRYGMNFDESSTEDVREFLERSLTLLERQQGKCPGLAKLCVRRALEANLPHLAFKFWNGFLRAKATDDGNHGENLSLRRAIAISLVKAYARGHGNLTRTQCQRMCHRLVAREVWRRFSWKSR